MIEYFYYANYANMAHITRTQLITLKPNSKNRGNGPTAYKQKKKKS